MNAINLFPVTSTAFKAYGYDPATQTLALQFQSGKTFHFPEVSVDKHSDLQSVIGRGESVGRWYNEHIKGKHLPVLFEPAEESAPAVDAGGTGADA